LAPATARIGADFDASGEYKIAADLERADQNDLLQKLLRAAGEAAN
jgi:hypothetical protein